MPEIKECCVYTDDHNKCSLKFNRNKECIECEKYTPEKEHIPSFRDEKWSWKTGMGALTRAFHHLASYEEHKFHTSEKAQEHCDSRREMGHYHFIPRSSESALRMLTHTFRYLGPKMRSKPKFLDCGCGVGNIVLLAHFVGFDAYGIEYDALTLNRGRRLISQFGLQRTRLMHGDILEFSEYHEYDLLYGYCPMVDSKLEKQFEQKLRRDMKIGALISGLGFTRGCEEIGKERIYFKQLLLEQSSAFGIGNPGIKIAHELK